MIFLFAVKSSSILDRPSSARCFELVKILTFFFSFGQLKKILSYPIEKSTHFWKINIFTKTAVFVIWVPKSLNMRSEWGNIKDCNKYPSTILNIHGHGGQKRNLFCFVPIPNMIVNNLCTKMHHLDMILFHSNMNHSYSFMVLLHCHVTDSLCFVYLCLHIT